MNDLINWWRMVADAYKSVGDDDSAAYGYRTAELIELQQKTITELCTVLEDVLYDLERCEVQIDSEWGSRRNIKQIEEDDDLPISIIEARKALAKARGGL